MEKKQDTRKNHARIGSRYNPLQVQIKRLYPDAEMPTYAHESDAGIDLYAHSMTKQDGIATYRTGIAVAIPEGYVGLIFPRSSIAYTPLALSNCVGVIDSGYRGEIILKFRAVYTKAYAQKWYQRIAEVLFGKFPDDKVNVTHFWGDDSNGAYKVGERIGQLIIMPYPKVALESVSQLPTSDRGAKGFGSTGK